MQDTYGTKNLHWRGDHCRLRGRYPQLQTPQWKKNFNVKLVISPNSPPQCRWSFACSTKLSYIEHDDTVPYQIEPSSKIQIVAVYVRHLILWSSTNLIVNKSFATKPKLKIILRFVYARRALTEGRSTFATKRKEEGSRRGGRLEDGGWPETTEREHGQVREPK